MVVRGRYEKLKFLLEREAYQIALKRSENTFLCTRLEDL